MTAKLYVIGDSFSEAPGEADKTATWPLLVAQGLSAKLDKEITLVNPSLTGSSQDYTWKFLQQWASEEITPDDYLVVALTHPSRYWYFEDAPSLTNMSIVDLEWNTPRHQLKAIEYYVNYIQRLELDTIHVKNRMGYIAYQILKKSLNKPLFIKCFNQELGHTSLWDEINVAYGDLEANVQAIEFTDPNPRLIGHLWKKRDGRYNHMCLSNHKILAEKVLHSLLTGNRCDLTTGFIGNQLTKDILKDTDFVQKELNLNVLLEKRR